ncbi:hypothetical protein F7725_009404 [Dissostichus mawsoni]|uniref:Uncharacterized protein n=1 Tax=Dissostichus mawsoni TaxID=36200 RepID=A0A7J5XKM4_DISMA|nr:hypothetical protein F7725_009404 [Dissostichus mawsoni]
MSLETIMLPLAHSPIKTPSSAYTKNVIFKASLNIWNQFRRFFDLQTYSTLAPLTANHVFPPSLVDGAFTIWSNQGIKTFKDLHIHNTFASFQQLSDKLHYLANISSGIYRFAVLLIIDSLSFLITQLIHH